MPADFFIVGAPKSGTTSLYHYLDQHPQIHMCPVKEPCFFASEVRRANFAAAYRANAALDPVKPNGNRGALGIEKRFSGIVETWSYYVRLFDGVNGEIAVCEASVCYLWSPTAAQNIASRVPHAKIVAVLRHPVDRAWSQYLHGVANGYVRATFREHVDACIASPDAEFSPVRPFLELGAYYRQIKAYTELFPRENIRIYFYQDGLAAIIRDLIRFLGVNTSFEPDISKTHLNSSSAEIPGTLYRALRTCNLWHPLRKLAPDSLRPHLRKLAFGKYTPIKMTDEDRRFLCAYYREDVLELASFLGRDLSSWLK